MIRYKVTRKNRTSCIISHQSRFCQKYLKGKIVRADPETLGIFTFETEKAAKLFIWPRPWLILRVQPIGKGKIPKLISLYTYQEHLIRFIKNLTTKHTTRLIPTGTICYPAVKVLD